MLLCAGILPMPVTAGILLLMNLLCFLLFAIDKNIAVRQGNVRRRRGSMDESDKYTKDWRKAYQKAHVPASRIPEGTLLLSAALFGAVGGTLGMYLLRHKTKKTKFILVPIMAVAQVGLLVWLKWKGIV